MFFDSDQQGSPGPQYDGKNLFRFSEDQKLNINKRLPRGFCFIKKTDLNRFLPKIPVSQPIEIEYVPVKKQKRVASKQLQNSLNLITSMNQTPQVGGRTRGLALTMEGKTRQMEKIKNIIQKFRKHQKYNTLANYLGKIGLLQALNEIETQNRKNLLTIQAFKDRYRMILDTAKNMATHVPTIQLFDDMIEEFLMYVEQARKAEFQNNIQSIQKSVDKITRHISEVKAQGNWYFKKKKKSDKVFNESEILHLSDLISSLPTAYLVGIWQIIEEKPFSESFQESLNFNLSEIGNKKLKEIEAYTKNKLLLIRKSRKRKREKTQMKREKSEDDEEEERESKMEHSVSGDVFKDSKPYDEIDQLFKNDKEEDDFKISMLMDDPESKSGKERKKERNMENELPSENNSSDSSMITDEDDSQF